VARSDCEVVLAGGPSGLGAWPASAPTAAGKVHIHPDQSGVEDGHSGTVSWHGERGLLDGRSQALAAGNGSSATSKPRGGRRLSGCATDLPTSHNDAIRWDKPRRREAQIRALCERMRLRIISQRNICRDVERQASSWSQILQANWARERAVPSSSN